MGVTAELRDQGEQVRVTQLRLARRRFAVGALTVREELIPALRMRSDFLTGYWLANAHRNEAVAITVWQPGDAATRRTAVGARVADAVGAAVTVAAVYEVVAVFGAGHEAGGPPAAARVTWASPPVASPRTGSRATDEIAAEYDRTPGFHSCYWLLDRSTGNGLAVSFWASPAARDADPAGASRRRAIVTRRVAVPTCAVDYDVAASTLERHVAATAGVDLRDLGTTPALTRL